MGITFWAALISTIAGIGNVTCLATMIWLIRQRQEAERVDRELWGQETPGVHSATPVSLLEYQAKCQELQDGKITREQFFSATGIKNYHLEMNRRPS